VKTLHSLIVGFRPATSVLAQRIVFLPLFLGAGLALMQPCAGAPFQFEETGTLADRRSGHTATLLPNGKVLVAGGASNRILATAELYHPANGTWTATGSLATARASHTATLLPNGKVLVAGGFATNNYLASAELYDPATGTWTATGSLTTAREFHTATLLRNGKVLIAGGRGNNGVLESAELYDPATGTWTVTGSLARQRDFHTATLLPNGKVLVAGRRSAELYDPETGTWMMTGRIATYRSYHKATLLSNGQVLVTGGVDSSGVQTVASAELYNPASGTWTETDSLATARAFHTATLLPNGEVLVAAGLENSGIGLRSAELYDLGLGFSSDWQPNIATATLRPRSGNRLFLTGSLFQGISQASGGTARDSSSNYPIVQLRSLDSSQAVFLLANPVGGWSDTSFSSLPVRNFPFGPALVTVFTNGIPSTAKYLVVEHNDD
jgi:hypothetical protein